MQTVIERVKPAGAGMRHRATGWKVVVVLAAVVTAIAISFALALTHSQVRPVGHTDAVTVTRALQVMHADAYSSTKGETEAARLHALQVMHADANAASSNDSETARLHALQQLKSGR